MFVAFVLCDTLFKIDTGETTIHFGGTKSGYGVVYVCMNGDTCNIWCHIGACDKSETEIRCFGKCFVTCQELEQGNTDCVTITTSLAPSNAPTDSPSLSPTVSPTHSPSIDITTTLSRLLTPNTAVTQSDLTNWFNWVVIVAATLLLLTIFFGCMDAWYWRNNDLFRRGALLSFGFYTLDFISDVFFSMRLFLYMIDDNFIDYQVEYQILFVGSLVFIVVPLVSNLYQLHNEISKWLVDPILSETDVPLWIFTFTRILYGVAVITGSSFSAVSLFNSNLFQWRIFRMGLSRYHRKRFRNKRFFSVVLLEVCRYMFETLIEIFFCIFCLYTMHILYN